MTQNKDVTKQEQKEIDKLLKEKDKLEMKAMVLRMQERDKQKEIDGGEGISTGKQDLT